MENPADVTLQKVFFDALQTRPRKHQIRAVRRQIEACEAGGVTRFLHQHAPGSGKTEVIALLTLELLSRGLFDAVVILNYAKELEDQMMTRAKAFWERGSRKGIPSKQAKHSRDLAQVVPKGSVLFSLLQKFPEENDFEPLPGESPSRFCVIIDEAHRGVPDEGVHIKSVLKRFGQAQTQIYFTATPKVETLQSHGTKQEGMYGPYYVAFDVHTQSDAVKERYTLNPLRRYMNYTASLKADGTDLISLNGKCTLTTFVDRLHKQKPSKIAAQQAHFIIDHLADVEKEMPVMLAQRHQIKHLVVASSQQAVYDLGEQLRKLAKARRGRKGKRDLVVGTFFSGVVRSSSGKFVRDKEANGGKTDAAMLEDSDIIVCCCKFLAGWDEWRVCSVFLCRRVVSEELLQQVLARATRNRIGTGKCRPLVFDLANHPDDVSAAVGRFWAETRHFEGPLGEVNYLMEVLDRPVADAGRRPAAEMVARMRVSDQVLLRANIIRYYRAAAPFQASELTLPFEKLHELLCELNAALADQLFGGDAALAKMEAESAASCRGHRPADTRPEEDGLPTTFTKTIPCALRYLRTALRLGRAKRPRTDNPPSSTPAKKRKTDADSLAEGTPELETPEKQEMPTFSWDLLGSSPSSPQSTLVSPALTPVRPAQRKKRAEPTLDDIKAALKQAAADVAVRYKKQLPKQGDGDTPDKRAEELKAFRFAAYPLRRFSDKSSNAVTNAERSLASQLNNALGGCMKTHWESQREAYEQRLEEAVEALKRVHGATPSQQLSQGAMDEATDVLCEYAEVVDQVGGRAAAWQKRKLKNRSSALLAPLGVAV